MSSNIITGAIVLLIGLTSVTWASPPKGNGPPPEAIEACDGKSEGESVSFETKRGHSMEGTCQIIEAQLVAVPEHHKSRK